MNRILLLLTLFNVIAWAGASESGSQVAWTADTIKQVKKGDPEQGKRLSGTCQSCHGLRGEGTNIEVKDDETLPAIPAIAGQNPYYMYKQLGDYSNEDRAEAVMVSIAKGISEQDAADLAAWFSSLPLPIQENEGKDFSAAQKMISVGDGKRILPPCSVCHGGKGQGDKIDIPSLAGQRADYFEKTLLAYRNGQRHNDIYSRMRLIAKQLTAEEIKALSIYYQQLK